MATVIQNVRRPIVHSESAFADIREHLLHWSSQRGAAAHRLGSSGMGRTAVGAAGTGQLVTRSEEHGNGD